jgi:hypothetical protein
MKRFVQWIRIDDHDVRIGTRQRAQGPGAAAQHKLYRTPNPISEIDELSRVPPKPAWVSRSSNKIERNRLELSMRRKKPGVVIVVSVCASIDM